MEENKISFTGLVKNLFQTSFKLVSDTASLACAEARLAKLSLKYIVILSFVFASLLSTTWLFLMTLAICILMGFHFSGLAALSIVTLFNIILMVTIGIIMLQLKSNLSFSGTRRQFHLSSNK